MKFQKNRHDRTNKQLKRKKFSIINKLEHEEKINENFKLVVNRLTLEELLACKMELAAKSSGGSVYGMKIWSCLLYIVRDAILRFSLTATRTYLEGARFLGLNLREYRFRLKKYGTVSFFDEPKPQDGINIPYDDRRRVPKIDRRDPTV